MERLTIRMAGLFFVPGLKGQIEKRMRIGKLHENKRKEQ